MSPYPSRLNANRLILMTTAFIITAGAWVQSLSLGLGLLITEGVLILLPALVFTVWGRRSLRQTFRLRWPGWRLTLLGLLVGGGIWFLCVTLEGLGSSLLGYAPPGPDGRFDEPGQLLAYCLAITFAAPLCEEMLWRGYIQRAYEGVIGGRAFWIVGLFFALWHLRFAGLLGVLPMALVLSYLAWRSDSLVPGLVAHAGFNGLAALTVALRTWGLVNDTALGIGVLMGILVGTPLALIGLFLFRRQTAPHIPGPEEMAKAPQPRSLLAWAWPVIVLLIIYGWVAIQEVAAGRSPELPATSPLQLEPAPWETEATWRYTVTNAVGEECGETTCRLTPGTDGFTLTCEDAWQPYEVHPNSSSTYINNIVTRKSTYHWDRKDLTLTAAAESATLTGSATLTLTATTAADGLRITSTQNVTAPAEALLEGEWAWRLAALPFADDYKGGTASLATRYGLLQEARVRLRGHEPVETPAGSFDAWRVELALPEAGQTFTAWYDANAPHTLVKYDDGVETYSLTK
ncbi:MAG: CPBP family intramembrane metalloprotease [Anaerolineae bacterium]|nr:CPBP family intramembrane metalloprotease [Anaerolineae bacterium]